METRERSRVALQGRRWVALACSERDGSLAGALCEEEALSGERLFSFQQLAGAEEVAKGLK